MLLKNAYAKFKADWAEKSSCPIQLLPYFFTALGIEFGKNLSYRMPTSYKEHTLQVCTIRNSGQSILNVKVIY